MAERWEIDQEAVRRVQRGDTEAFEILIRGHEKNIFNLLYRWLGDYDEAADAAQEVFLSTYRSIGRFRAESRFSTWLYRIAINHAKNRRVHLATARRRSSPLDAFPTEDGNGTSRDVPDPGPDPSQEAERRELHATIQEALVGLKSDDAAIILLHDLQGVSYEEIVDALGVPLGTVKSRLHRARQALKNKLGHSMDPSRA